MLQQSRFNLDTPAVAATGAGGPRRPAGPRGASRGRPVRRRLRAKRTVKRTVKKAA